MAKAKKLQSRAKRSTRASTLKQNANSNKKITHKLAKEKTTEKFKIPGSFRLTADTLLVIKGHWRILGGILLVYALINILFASGLANLSSSITNVKEDVASAETGSSSLPAALNGLTGLFGTGGATGSGSAAQSVLVVVLSLVIIWTLRQLLAGKKVSLKQAYYQSMEPLIPFVLVILVIILQLLPLTLGTAALGIVLSSVFANTDLIAIAISILFVVLGTWSLYMLCSSLMALYIVTLPSMQPRQALRSAKGLVKFRRWQLMRRIVYLPIFIIFAMIVIITPLIILLPAAAVIGFYVLGIAAILFAHTYLYSLYRSLL